MKKLALIAFLTAVSFQLTAGVVSAEETTTEKVVEKECETNAYGQETCTETTRERVLGVQRVEEAHKPVEASSSLPLLSMALIASAGAAVALRRTV